MCGIVGYAGINSDKSLILNMIKNIKHRGPDSDGFSAFENLCIGSTRLSIVDIEGGQQPIHTEDGDLTIVFNGEIYNHLELAKQYEHKIGVMRTKCDTEIILALYRVFKEKCLDKFQGMFCFAILDRKNKSIFLARDRIGIKPLYYWNSGAKLIFGSEIKSILSTGVFEREVNKNKILDYLSMRYVPGSTSLFKDIHRLKPGCWMKWEKGVLSTESYWSHDKYNGKFDKKNYQEEFDYLFEESIKARTSEEVKYGAYLSGGLDSNSIVNVLSKNSNTQINTFTIGFGWKGDELGEAKESAQKYNTNHHEILFKATDFEKLPKIIWHSDQPMGDPIVIPAFLLAEEASKHVKVILTGDGADEILCGYLFHKAVFLADKYKRLIPNFVHEKILLPTIKNIPANFLNSMFNYPASLGESGKKRLINFLDESRDSNPENLFRFFISLFDENGKKTVLNNEYFNKETNFQFQTSFENTERPILDQLTNIQFKDWLPDNILTRQDKMSMAHGLEARVPFLDHRLVEFMKSVPDHLKLSLFQNKIILRNSNNQQQVNSYVKRKKTAFYFPMEKYFENNTFKELLNNTMSKKVINNRGIFNYNSIDDLLKKMKNKDFLAAKQVFSIMSLELWHQIFIDKKMFN